jgi:serine/threonine protein kinase/Flp pilus assembly protein TadD
MPATTDRLKAVFDLAAEAPDVSTRSALLDRECAGDPALRERVEALLRAHDAGGSFLAHPPAAVLDAMASHAPEDGSTANLPYAGEGPGAAFGPYKLLQQIGEGGMGTVWMAQQQEPVQRLVAVKLIKAGMDSRQVIARFEAERQALALMDHVNIARVLDAGATSAGRPYFVMDLVKGVPITRYCDDNHLSPRQRLELFIPVCQAVQHAHQKGIIHRDLKPSNVLVALYDGKPVPKVIDFGVAKAAGQTLTEKTLVTGFGAIVGTLEYMSPEQAEFNQLDIDTRSDIYSLGVLLYELLAGSPPFSRKELEKAGLLEMLRVIREQEPAKPSTKLSTADGLPTLAANRGTEPRRLTALVRGELDWIVMRALEKDRNRRYETANGLALDVQRYLAGEAVQAVPPSMGYRLKKFVRRNKATVIATLLVATSLVLGTAISIWQAAVAHRAQADAADRLVRERHARDEATAINQLLLEGLGSANPDDAKGNNYSVRQLLDDISARLGDRLRDQPAAEAAIRATIGSAYYRLGLPEKAAPHLKRALGLREQLYGPDSPEVARSLYDEALNLQEYGDLPGALERASRALAIHRQAVLRNVETVRILWLLQIIHQRSYREDQSEQVGREALALARELPDAGPELAIVLHTLATNAVRLRGDFVEAERLTRESLALHRKYRGTNHPQTARALALLGALLSGRGDYGQAEPYLREAITIFKNNYGHVCEQELPAIIGLVAALRAKHDQAGLVALRADVTARVKRIREERPGDAGPLFYAALALALVDDTDGAVDVLSQIAAKKLGKHKVWYGRIYLLAWVLAIRPDSHQRYPGVALDLAQQAVDLAPQDGDVQQTLGIAQYRASNFQAAVQALDKAVELRCLRDVVSWLFLAMAHWRLGEKDKAREWYDRAAQWMDKNKPKDDELRPFRTEAAELLGLKEKT